MNSGTTTDLSKHMALDFQNSPGPKTETCAAPHFSSSAAVMTSNKEKSLYERRFNFIQFYSAGMKLVLMSHNVSYSRTF